MLDFAAVDSYLAIMLLVTAMVGMGASLSVQEFGEVCRAPQGVLSVLIAQVVVTPLVAIGLAYLLRLPALDAFGLLLIAAMPGGLFSNLLTYFGRGNVALSITATAVSTLLCLLSTSIVLRLYAGTYLPADFAMPVGSILFEIACFLLLPLLIGMTIRRFWPVYAPYVSRNLVRLSTILLGLYVVGALSSGQIEVASHGWRTPVALLLFAALAMWSGVGVAALFRLSPDDRFTVAIEVQVRNGSLALVLKDTLPDSIGQGVLYVILFYAGASLVLGLYESGMKRMKWGPLYVEPRAKEDPN